MTIVFLDQFEIYSCIKKQIEDAVTIRQLTQRKFLDDLFSGTKRQGSPLQHRPLKKSGMEFVLEGQSGPLPSRPDDTILSDAIPLFFIGRNPNGFWVAREAAGRCGGLFISRRSAVRFARKNSLVGGGATMAVKHRIELDLPNQGSRLAELIAALTKVVTRRAPRVANLICFAIAQLRSLDSQISHTLADHRRNREAIENDLFRGEYELVSKNDEDLPISPRV